MTQGAGTPLTYYVFGNPSLRCLLGETHTLFSLHRAGAADNFLGDDYLALSYLVHAGGPNKEVKGTNLPEIAFL